MRLVRGEGETPCRFMVVGERPGAEEHEEGRPFVGPAGQELWARVWKILRMYREDFYVTNLVKTFSMDPPTAEEVERDRTILNAELLRCRPDVIITIGYHAARFFLPQFRSKTGDFFHGLPFEFSYGKHRPRTALVVPCCHSSAALRNPDRYQSQLTEDLRACRHVIKNVGRVVSHQTRRPPVYQVGLASFGREGRILGVDTEGSYEKPEAVTLTHTPPRVACIEVHNADDPTKPKHFQFLSPSLSHAKAWAIHYSLHDVPILKKLGARPPAFVHDTMLEAYLLGLPQSLKVLAFRELGYEMDDYIDLVSPLDERLVRETLQSKLLQWETAVAKMQRTAGRLAIAKTPKGKRVTKKLTNEIFKRLHLESDVPPNRVISGLRRMLHTSEIATVDDDAE